ncbi:MAG TPA: hypothetical protein VKU41_25290 [Polyangiaceae bacterium]|nr:hypothetical protein [Polyangiaceae bacterium]
MTILILTVAGAAAFYVVGMNVFLGTRLFRSAINADPDSLRVEYASARSLLPGHIHVEGLHIRGRDHHVEWILVVDRCDFRASFSELLHKRFHASDVRAEGLSMRVRRRRDTFTREETAALAPVPGFVDPPLTDVGPPLAPLTDENYNLWSIRLDGVDVRHVREIWIDTLRYTGDLHVLGRWFFRPIRWLEVGPAEVDMHPMDLSYGTIEPWATGIEGTLHVTIHPTALRDLKIGDLLDHVSVNGDLEGVADLANPLNRLSRTVRVLRARPAVAAQIQLDHGVLRPGTLITADSFDAVVAGVGLSFHASLDARLGVGPDGGGSATVGCSGLRVLQEGYPRARARRIVAELASHDLDLSHPFSDATYHVAVDGAETESLRYWRTRVPSGAGVSVDSGPVTASLRLAGAVATETGHGRLEATVRDLLVAKAAMKASTSRLSVRADVKRVCLLDGRFAGAVRASADAMAIEREGMTAKGDTALDLTVREGRWRTQNMEGSGVLSIHGLHGSIKGLELFAPAVEIRADGGVAPSGGPFGKASVRAPDIELPALATIGRLVRLPATLAVDSGSGRASLQADWDLTHGTGTASALFTTQGLRAHVGTDAMAGELRVAVRGVENRGIADFSGSTLSFSEDDAGGTKAWWGRVELQNARFDTQNPRFSATLLAHAKDASPLTSIVKSNTAIPNWLIDAVSTKGLEVKGEVLAGPSTFEARSVTARTEGIDADVEYGKSGPKNEWAMLLDIGVLSAGFHGCAGRKTEVQLLDARRWFEEKAASVKTRFPPAQ